MWTVVDFLCRVVVVLRDPPQRAAPSRCAPRLPAARCWLACVCERVCVRHPVITRDKANNNNNNKINE